MTTNSRRGIALTVAAILTFIIVIVASFVYRVQQPRVMTEAETRANGLFLFETPRDLGAFSLIDHRGQAFTRENLKGTWTLVFWGFTHCPDICPTTMAFLADVVSQLEQTEAEDTQVVMMSVDPARDTQQVLAQYVPYFHSDFVGVTGEFTEILQLAHRFSAPFRKVTEADGSYQVDHSANVALVNPRGDFHGFFRAPLDLAKFKVTYRSTRYLWEH